MFFFVQCIFPLLGLTLALDRQQAASDFADRIKKGLARAHMSDAGVWAHARRKAASGGGGGRHSRGQLLKDGVHFLMTGTPETNKLTGLALQAITSLDLQNYTVSTYVHDAHVPHEGQAQDPVQRRLLQRYAFLSNRLHTLPPLSLVVFLTNEVFVLPNRKGFRELLALLHGTPTAQGEEFGGGRHSGNWTDQFDVLCLPLPGDVQGHDDAGNRAPGPCDSGFVLARNTPRVAKIVSNVLHNLQQTKTKAEGHARDPLPSPLSDSAMFNRALGKVQARALSLQGKYFWSGGIGCPNFDRHPGQTVALLTMAGPCPVSVNEKLLQATRTLNGVVRSSQELVAGSAKEEAHMLGLGDRGAQG